ncbi:reactive mitochondrial oxygen species modulator 1-domain-containing protein [Cokeromyces recurvatus]|uniref:reactive mitochondrial oxygen species modulator 1-domain-containing protein n=1 Tax=Cokeromyces recurvatus TaxID=90255 RepID=UPI00221FB950|nr:reactive mitochondrial oxygen species modulator 1-domain-containing protein [Cokeromyces recurvatus]KAI7905726.1 reactive mitochondrial oxygen species modulator 1-domain-containing protein [Cokeromyces recurvatus]
MEPSTFDKMKMGAMMGGTVGLCIGFVFGSISLMRYGSGSKGPITMLSKYMIGSAASFGFFMSIGSVVRSESRFQTPNMNLPVIINNHRFGENKSAFHQENKEK